MRRYYFSIIIPAYNRCAEVQDLLRSLQRQTFDPQRFEVIVVDDGSTDDTKAAVEQLMTQVSFQLRYFLRDHIGPGAARNYGMSLAEGEYFLFIDSDCLADERWLEELERAIEQEKPLAFGGPDGVLPEFSPLQKAIDYAMTSFFTTGGMRGHSPKRLAKFYPRSYNMGIHYSIFASLGGMNHLRHGQDLEFSRRIVASGAKVIYIPEARVYHKRRTSLRKFFRQIFNWGVARINLTKLDRGILEPLHFMPAIGTDTFIILTLLAPFWQVARWAWLICLLLGVILLGIIKLDAYRRYRDWRAAILAPVVAVTQIFAYGLGFTAAYIWRMILGKPEFTGFVKQYYK
jgi:glycosyltransferase involved in cell wall biosynthesis